MSIPKAFIDLLSSSLVGTLNFPPTKIFEEGWMLRILLEAHHKGRSCFPIPYYDDSTWYSEGIISSPFSLKPYAESGTRSDGIIGHIKIRVDTKAGIRLEKNARQFVVLEAKMKSGLSSNVDNAGFYDQASRYLACICKTIELSNCAFSDIDSIGFYVIAPEDQINQNIFSKYLNPNNILNTVEKRVNQYMMEDCYSSLVRWYNNNFKPFMNYMKCEGRIGCIKWEEAVDKIEDVSEKKSIREFLYKCYEHM